MPRVSIQQFRATLAGRSDQGTVVRAYRKLARRPEVVTAVAFADWTTWPPAAPAASA
ncbi:MAG TPA: hypothetical protein VM890_09855 [Longimicrobium sp.]|jgi:hypothetical protein|nr:hypothetical protein [Longimicrobium sp.]